MILPSKHLNQDRALLTVGARILQLLKKPRTVSALWEQVARPTEKLGTAPLRYDAFVLALDLLYLMGGIELENGIVRRQHP